MSNIVSDLELRQTVTAERLRRFLLFINAGGAIASLSLLGAFIANGQKPLEVVLILCAFLAGLAAAGMELVSAVAAANVALDSAREQRAKGVADDRMVPPSDEFWAKLARKGVRLQFAGCVAGVIVGVKFLLSA